MKNMQDKELKFLISQGEGYNLEFKEALSDTFSLTREICAFANANGGKILLGVSDNKEIKGIVITNRLKSQVYDITRNLDPRLEVSLEEIDNVLIINVPEGLNKPYSINGRFFIRYGSNSQQLSRDEIKDFFQKEGLILFDEKPNYDFNLAKDFAKDKFKTFLEIAKISPIIPTTEILDNLSLIKNHYLKNAGVLLFSFRVTKFFTNASIICVLYQGKTKYKILDRKEFEADVYNNFLQANQYLQSKLNTEFIIKGGKREERLELPEDALREALLNALSHRDYFSNASILLEIFSDRVEITNPGGLVKGITKKDLGKKSLSRNNLLFGLLQRMGLVEKVGSGIIRMKKAMKDYGLKGPDFDITQNWFTLIFKRPTKEKVQQWSEQWSEKWSEKGLTKRQIALLTRLKENPKITRKELAKRIKINPSAVQKHIEKFKEKDIIKRIGPDKGGYWDIIEK